MNGNIKALRATFGFIETATGADYFFHDSDVLGEGDIELKVGDRVTFEVVEPQPAKGPSSRGGVSFHGKRRSESMKICPAAGCGVPVVRGRCEKHQRSNSALSREGSTWRWRNLRRLHLTRYPICEVEECLRPAAVVDHHHARVLGGSDEPDNLVSYCRPHHYAKHNGAFLRLRSRPSSTVTFA